MVAVMLTVPGYLPLATLATAITGFVLLARGMPLFGSVLLLAALFVFARYYALTREMGGHAAECDRCMELERAFLRTSLEVRGVRWLRWAMAHQRLVSAHLQQVYGGELRYWLHRIDPATLEARHKLPKRLSQILEDLEHEPDNRAESISPEDH